MLPNGYFLIDKPKGISSFKAIIQAKDALAKSSGVAFKKIKIGHAGTLDPLASGLLLCAVGSGTKMLSHLLLAEKKYIADIYLGEYSETDDSEGEKFDHPEKRTDTPSQEEIENVLKKFVGIIEQLSPKYSALKIDGKRSCDRLRKGQAVFQKNRSIEIFSIDLLKYSYPLLQISVQCGSGTYIRSLARDIGDMLQTGGYIQDLQRTSVGRYALKDTKMPEKLTLDDIQKFTPKDIDMPCVYISKDQYNDLYMGKSVDFFIGDISDQNELLGLYIDDRNEVVGFGKRDKNFLRPKTMMTLCL